MHVESQLPMPHTHMIQSCHNSVTVNLNTIEFQLLNHNYTFALILPPSALNSHHSEFLLSHLMSIDETVKRKRAIMT